MRHILGKRNRTQILIYLVLLAAVCWTLFPFYWTAVTSFKESAEIGGKPLTYWPRIFTVENYIQAWKRGGFSGYFLNSLKVSLISTVFTRP